MALNDLLHDYNETIYRKEFDITSETDLLHEANFSSNFTDSLGELLKENWLNLFNERFMRHSMTWSITPMIAYTFILVVGVIGNLMVILVVMLRKQMRSATNMFIMNLAVADLFVIVFCVPSTLLSNLFTPWILGTFMCKFVTYVQGVSVCASAYSLTVISIDRCKAIYRPYERSSGLSKSQAMFSACLIWLIALLLTIPWAIVFNISNSNKYQIEYCIETWGNEFYGKLYFLVVNFILCYFLPLLLICISHLAIWCRVSHRKVPLNSASAEPIKRVHKNARQSVVKMLGIVTLIFMISWLPLYAIVMRTKFGENISEDEYSLLGFLMPFAQLLGSANSCVNPVIYAFFNAKYRDMFKSLLPSWMPLAKPNNMVIIARYNRASCTITNGTFEETNETRNHTTVSTRRSQQTCISDAQRCSGPCQSLITNSSRKTGTVLTIVTTTDVTSVCANNV